MPRPILVVALCLASSALIAPDASAQPRRRTASLRSEVSVVQSRAPDADARAVRSELVQYLAHSRRRIQRCIAESAAPRDPMDRASGSVVGEVRFGRAGRPRVRMLSAQRVSPATSGCVERVVRSMRLRNGPRGEVVLRFQYYLR